MDLQFTFVPSMIYSNLVFFHLFIQREVQSIQLHFDILIFDVDMVF